METITSTITMEKATKFVEGILKEPHDGSFNIRKREFVNLLSKVEDAFVKFSSDYGRECDDYARASLKEIAEVISEVKTLATWADID